ncbi:MAG: hypothetical protein IPM92_09860 [Saprospiraceae bacterium]|nr:hypothetical protein [Saprospiraceae bacterium]
MQNFNQLILDTNETLGLNSNINFNSSYIGLPDNGPEMFSHRIPQVPRNCSLDWTSRFMCGKPDEPEVWTIRILNPLPRRGIC